LGDRIADHLGKWTGHGPIFPMFAVAMAFVAARKAAFSRHKSRIMTP
jgi:hypothetical protein